MLLCLALVAIGFFLVLNGDSSGVALIIVGSLSFLIIAQKTDKVKGYDPKHIMNR